MEYLAYDDFILINRLTVERHGGNFAHPQNLLNPDALQYLIEAVEGNVFGRELYPTLAEKTGFYFFSVISRHIFQDGNKRTGLEAALLFLKLNGYQLKEHLEKVSFDKKTIPATGEYSEAVLYNFVMETASGKVQLEECSFWFQANIVTIHK